MSRRIHLPETEWCIAECSDNCSAVLRSPFPGRDRDPDGLGTFAAELCREFGIDSDEISTSDVARAWARTMGWSEEPDGWFCPQHSKPVIAPQGDESSTVIVDLEAKP